MPLAETQSEDRARRLGGACAGPSRCRRATAVFPDTAALWKWKRKEEEERGEARGERGPEAVVLVWERRHKGINQVSQS